MTNRRQGRFSAPIALVLWLVPPLARTDEPEFGPTDVPTVFFISKSDDHNRVDYGMRLSASCAPVGKDPVFPYWREFEPPAPVRTHPLGTFEYLAYGISDQREVRNFDGTTEWQIRLRRLPRPVFITTRKDASGRCMATPKMTIHGSEGATLVSVFVKLKGVLSVAYLDLFGTAKETGERLEERVVP